MVENTLMKNTQVAKSNFSTFMGSEGVKRKLNEIIGGEKGQSFITSIVSAVSANPVLKNCDNASIFSAGLVGASLNLAPSRELGYFYIIPYGNKAQFQIGYKGLIQLAIRTGQYKHLNVIEVKQDEMKFYNQLTEEFEFSLIEDPEEREKTPTVGYFAMFELLNGFTKTVYWTKAKMEAHAKKYSQSYRSGKSSFWQENFDEMAKKTLLKQILTKWGMMSTEMEKAKKYDQATIKEDMTPEYVDNQPDITEPIQAEVMDKNKNPQNSTVEDEFFKQC